MADYVPVNLDPYSAHQLLLRLCRGAQTVLDVGCSAGGLARALKVGADVRVDGIESDPVAAAEARNVCERVLAIDVESGELDLEPAFYDVLLMADVIEHLREPVMAMTRLRPYLKPGGRLILSTPNVANWSLRLLHLAGRWDYQDRGLMDRTHLRFFTARTLRAALTAAGYQLVEMTYTCPLPVLRRQPFNRAAWWLAHRWPGLLAYQFIAVARPLPPSPPAPARRGNQH